MNKQLAPQEEVNYAKPVTICATETLARYLRENGIPFGTKLRATKGEHVTTAIAVPVEFVSFAVPLPAHVKMIVFHVDPVKYGIDFGDLPTFSCTTDETGRVTVSPDPPSPKYLWGAPQSNPRTSDAYHMHFALDCMNVLTVAYFLYEEDKTTVKIPKPVKAVFMQNGMTSQQIYRPDEYHQAYVTFHN